MDLDAIEQRTRAATEGPWEYDGRTLWGRDDIGRIKADTPEDRAFTTAARTDVPALVARVRELEAENTRLRKAAHDAFRLGLRLEDQPGTIYHRSFWEEPEDHLRHMSTYTGGNLSTREGGA